MRFISPKGRIKKERIRMPKEKEFLKEKFLEERKAIIELYGMYTEVDGRRACYLPCVTWQKLMDEMGVFERTNAPRYYNATLMCWFSPPDILEEELKEYDFKWLWNQFGECEHCPSRTMCGR
jgi:hypothetical protein